MNPIIENLIKLADMFDQAGEGEKADEIDAIIQQMSAPETEPQSLKTEAQNAYSDTMSKVYAELRKVGKQNALSILKELNDMFRRMASDENKGAEKKAEEKQDIGSVLKSSMASLSDMADSLDKVGAVDAADRIDAFLAKYSDVDWKEEGNTEQSKRYDDRHHHEQQVKEPKDYHKSGPDEHHIKEYDKSRTGLSQRTCPDHIGAQLGRIGPNIYQCPIDSVIYNWEEGFDTEDGRHYDGGSVAGQTPNSTGYFATPSRIWDSREEVLNRIN